MNKTILSSSFAIFPITLHYFHRTCLVESRDNEDQPSRIEMRICALPMPHLLVYPETQPRHLNRACCGHSTAIPKAETSVESLPGHTSPSRVTVWRPMSEEVKTEVRPPFQPRESPWHPGNRPLLGRGIRETHVVELFDGQSTAGISRSEMCSNVVRSRGRLGS
jgi:hypothetical protein